MKPESRGETLLCLKIPLKPQIDVFTVQFLNGLNKHDITQLFPEWEWDPQGGPRVITGVARPPHKAKTRTRKTV